MSPSTIPKAELSMLPKADGSATFSYCGYTVTASVNGPIEASRRDENPFEAILDINVRPAAGVGGTAERQLESILQPALRQLIPIRNFPRCMIQITLQITETPENAYVNFKLNQARLNLSIIPALLHASVLGLLTAAIPLKSIATAVALAIPSDDSNSIIADPSSREAETASSLHVLSFTSDNELLLVESEGSFSPEEWEQVLQAGEHVCCQSDDASMDKPMQDGALESTSIKSFIRSVMETKTAGDLHWK